MIIREATSQDAEEICRVLKSSITELCRADHKNDPKILKRWAGSKTPDMMREWMSNPESTMLVVCEEDKILAVGAVDDHGGIGLNYVDPDARFKGVSKLLLSAMEEKALQQGIHKACLMSTKTAKRFYSANGYKEYGKLVDEMFGIPLRPMSKKLVESNEP